MKLFIKKMKLYWKTNFFIWLQLTILFVYCLVEMAMIQETFWEDRELKARLGDTYERMVQLDVQDDTDYGKFESVRQELLGSGCYETVCFYHNSSVVSEDGTEYNLLQVSEGMEQILQVDISQGRFFEKSDFTSPESFAVVGAAVAEKYGIKPGDDLKAHGFDRGGKVLGILNKNQRWFLQSLDEVQSVLLDNQIIQCDNEKNMRIVYYAVVKKGVSQQKSVQLAEKAAEKNGVIMSASLLKEMEQKNMESTLQENIQWMAFVLVILIMIAVGTTLIIYARLQEQSREIGIYMAFGYNRGKIIQTQTAEIAFVSICAYLVSYPAARILVGSGQEQMWNMICITGRSVEPEMMGVVLGLMFIVLLPSVFMIVFGILRMQPARLIGGKE